MAVKAPDKKFEATPAELADSKLMAVETEDLGSGIIFDSVDELAQALRLYGSGSVPKSRATQTQFYKDIEKSRIGNMAPAIVMLATVGKGDQFTEDLVKDVQANLKSKKNFRKSFDYDAMDTNFFKSTVDVDKVDNKYVLKLYAAYVGDEPEKSLAATIGKPLALTRSSAKARMSVVNDWWFNINLENLLKGLVKKPASLLKSSELENFDLEAIASVLAKKADKMPSLDFVHNGKHYSVMISLDASTHLTPKGSHVRYLQQRGVSIVGGAWDDVYGKETIKPKAPSIDLSVRIASYLERNNPEVTPENIMITQAGRDYLATQLRNKINQ